MCCGNSWRRQRNKICSVPQDKMTLKLFRSDNQYYTESAVKKIYIFPCRGLLLGRVTRWRKRISLDLCETVSQIWQAQAGKLTVLCPCGGHRCVRECTCHLDNGICTPKWWFGNEILDRYSNVIRAQEYNINSSIQTDVRSKTRYAGQYQIYITL